MFARLTAKAILAAGAIAMAFFGIGLLGMALASALVALLGTVGGYAVVANINSEKQAVIGGASGAIDAAVEAFQKAAVSAQEAA